jgi:hypothetical protein
VDIGQRVSAVCHLANTAIKLGRNLKWNPKRKEFVGDDEANQMLDRPRRAPWQLPKVSGPEGSAPATSHRLADGAWRRFGRLGSLVSH